MAEARRTRANRHDRAIDFQRHAAGVEIESVERMPLIPQHEERRRAVVRDRIGKGDLPVGDAAVDDLDRGDRVISGGGDGDGGDVRAVQVGGHDQRDFRLRLGLQHPRRVEYAAVGNRHVGEQRAIVGLVDAELRLHRRGGQADLAPDQPSPFAQPRCGVQLLHRIGAGTVACIEPVAQGTDRPVAIGSAQTLGERGMCDRWSQGGHSGVSMCVGVAP